MKGYFNMPAPATSSSSRRTTPKREYRVEAVDRVVRVLGALETSRPISLRQVAEACELGEATTLRYLASLARHDLVERQEDGRYRLGTRLISLGQSAIGNRRVRAAALPVMERLQERFEETVNLAVWRRDSVIIIDALEGSRSIKRGAAIGERDSWHTSSLGKAILAMLPADEARSLLGDDLQRLTYRTLVDPEELAADFARIRKRGYALDEEESEEGLTCVGVAIRDRRGRPGYAMSLAGPTSRFGPSVIEEMGGALAEAAPEISKRLGFADESPADIDETQPVNE